MLSDFFFSLSPMKRSSTLPGLKACGAKDMSVLAILPSSYLNSLYFFFLLLLHLFIIDHEGSTFAKGLSEGLSLSGLSPSITEETTYTV
jgi:hypothetical protein